MRPIQSVVPAGPFWTVVPAWLHGRISSLHIEETSIERHLDLGLSIIMYSKLSFEWLRVEKQ